jgi:hypothetical protein
MAATRIVNRLGVGGDIKERAAALTTLTSFEFFGGLAENSKNERRARTIVLELARKMLNSAGGWRCRQSIHRPQIERKAGQCLQIQPTWTQNRIIGQMKQQHLFRSCRRNDG